MNESSKRSLSGGNRKAFGKEFFSECKHSISEANDPFLRLLMLRERESVCIREKRIVD